MFPEKRCTLLGGKMYTEKVFAKYPLKNSQIVKWKNILYRVFLILNHNFYKLYLKINANVFLYVNLIILVLDLD